MTNQIDSSRHDPEHDERIHRSIGEAVARAAAGRGCTDKRMDNALQRARRKLKAAA